MENAPTRTPQITEPIRRAPVTDPQSRELPRPFVEGLDCLRESAVPYALLHADLAGLESRAHLDLLIDPAEHRIAFAALRRAGYREMRSGWRFAGAHVFLRFEDERFYALVVRSELAQNGMRYMDAALARSRYDTRGARPLLSPEDRFLHVLVSSLLAGRELDEAEKVALRLLRRNRLDRVKLRQQSSPHGMDGEIERIVADLELYLWDPKQWRKLRRRVLRALLSLPENRRGWWRHLRASRLRWSFNPVVLAVVGPPGSGCTSFAHALVHELERSPFRPERVTMGCWNGTSRWSRLLRSMAPTRVAWSRLFRAACGRPAHLSDAERRYFANERPRVATLALRAAWHEARNALFFALLSATLAWRYWRHVARCREAIVVADGWVYDLGFQPGSMPYSYGTRLRRRFYLQFPLPDGILYASTPYDHAVAHSPDLEREPYEAMHRGMRRLLAPQEPLELVAEGPPAHMARTFLRRYWAHLLHRHNRKS